jgi:uncharacterized protein YhbP (UPF0306 family)
MRNNTNVAKDIQEYLNKTQLMQLATSVNDRPWVATVYFVQDDMFNFYWLSTPHRKHSEHLDINPRVAIAIAIKPDIPVIGLQAEGRAEIVHDLTTIAKLMPRYIKKYNAGKDFLSLAKKGINNHRMYKFSPELLQYFDEQHYTPDENPITLLFEE